MPHEIKPPDMIATITLWHQKRKKIKTDDFVCTIKKQQKATKSQLLLKIEFCSDFLMI